jgi:D-alanine-D-alanine ligase
MKTKLGVIYGGMSSENEVSKVSASYVLDNLDKSKYDIYPIYIDKTGKWFYEDKEIDNYINFLKDMDVLFPVLHGLYGEDGTIQGLFELIKKPYVGCKVLGSALGMDKIYAKNIFKSAGINVAPYVYVKKIKDDFILVDKHFNEEILSLEDIILKIEEEIKYPIFIKPSNQGSSVGITKAHNRKELESGLIDAFNYDRKVLLEEQIVGREVECGVLGNEEVIASSVGEVIVKSDEFYSYDAKYNDGTTITEIPAAISKELSDDIRRLAIKAFKAIDGKGLSRVDFFIEEGTKKIIINEINTLPGFTSISMYPKLFDNVGIKYSELLDRLIELAKE